ncbi:MAG: hypothetical protein ABI402_06235 [Ferruginibacter sp.]
MDLVIKRLQNDKEMDTLIQNWEGLSRLKKSYPDIYSLLKNIGIKHISSHQSVYVRMARWYYFETNWPNEYLICLIYDQYDSSQTKKGYYSKDEVANETWGLGNNWDMFRWVKNKPYVQ